MTMALTPKNIISAPKNIIFGVVDRGLNVVSGATGLLRRDDQDEASTSKTAAPKSAPKRAGGTKTGATTRGSKRTARAAASGASASKPAAQRKRSPKAGARGPSKSSTAKS